MLDRQKRRYARWTWPGVGRSAPAGPAPRAPARHALGPGFIPLDSGCGLCSRRGANRPAAVFMPGRAGGGMMSLELTAAQKRYLRGLGQALAPTLQIGREGVTPAAAAALEPLLQRNELLKGKVQRTSEAD